MLAQSQINEYRERGFIAVPDVLPADVLEELRDEVARFVEKSRQVSENDAVFDLEPSHTPEDPRLRRLKNPAQVSAVFDRVMRSDALLDLADPLLGFNGIRYRNDKLNLKIAEVGSPVEWHQDYAFYPHSNDDVLAIGVCLDDCTLENGCLRCIPGSHRLPVLDHHAGGAFAGAVKSSDGELDLGQAEPLVLKAGSVSIHHARTLHGSEPNTSNIPRRLWLIELTAADAWPLMGMPDIAKFKSWLLRGEEPPMMRCSDHVVRIPLPQPTTVGSIYEVQRQAKETVYR